MDLIVSHYASKTARNNIDGYVEHTPRNVYDIVALAKQFPNLKFINIVRDGRAVMASLMRMDWGPCDVLSGSNYWQKHVTAGLAAVEYLGYKNAITIRYEDLLTNEQDTMKRLENILCLPLSDDKVETVIPRYTKVNHELVNKAADLTRINTWLTSLTKRDVELFELRQGILLSYFNYQLVNDINLIPPLSLVERIILYFKGRKKVAKQLKQYEQRHGI